LPAAQAPPRLTEGRETNVARYTESVCRLCRRENLKMYLKGDRCYTDKCAIERRPYPPGQHGQGRVKFSEYGVQLREKQKVKRMYGLLEAGFSHAYWNAAAAKGKTGENLLQTLELRLDNVVFRLGFADTRNEARQLVRHGHFRINARKVNIPSFRLKAGDRVELRDRSKKVVRINEALEAVDRRSVPGWLELDKAGFKGTVKSIPAREEITMPIQEQLIVELYSK
jgi:small subunit ribosomal protein S4